MNEKTKLHILLLTVLLVAIAAMVWLWSLPNPEPVHEANAAQFSSAIQAAIPTTTAAPTTTTTAAPPTTTTDKPRITTPATVRAGRSAGGRSDVWTALASCESGDGRGSYDPTARSASGRYTGAFQFSDATWQSLGESGSAASHPYSVQLAAAKRLQARDGWGQWPRCSRKLGLAS